MDVKRTRYLENLAQWKDTQVSKVITGIRRCVKSTLLRQYQAMLADLGVGDEQIISINFEDLVFEELLDHKALYHHIKSRLVDGRMNYTFLKRFNVWLDSKNCRLLLARSVISIPNAF